MYVCNIACFYVSRVLLVETVLRVLLYECSRIQTTTKLFYNLLHWTGVQRHDTLHISD